MQSGDSEVLSRQSREEEDGLDEAVQGTAKGSQQVQDELCVRREASWCCWQN